MGRKSKPIYSLRTPDFGGLEHMKTDMESKEQDAFSGSSPTRPRNNSGKSRANSRKNSKPVQAEDDGQSAEPKLSSLDLLLSFLQSDLGEIRDMGGAVRLFDDPNGLIIQLPNVAICHSHKMMHFGPQCPIC